jgi:hypothetical protein
MNRWSQTPFRVLNLAAFVPLIIGNALAGAGALSGESIGVVANRWQTLILPANWTFGIWSLIYLGLAAFVVYQALPREGARQVAGRIGPLWLVTIVLNLAWITTFSFSQFGSALVVMVALFTALVVVFMRLDIGVTPVGWDERVLVQAPFCLYLGWIAVALIVNTAQYLSYLGWDGRPLGPVVWAVIMMVAATAVAALFNLLRGEWIISLVVTWALVGVGARYADLPVLAGATWTLAVLNVLLPLTLRFWRRGGPTRGSMDGRAFPQDPVPPTLRPEVDSSAIRAERAS